MEFICVRIDPFQKNISAIMFCQFGYSSIPYLLYNYCMYSYYLLFYSRGCHFPRNSIIINYFEEQFKVYKNLYIYFLIKIA